MTSYRWVTNRRPWHRRILSRLRRALQKKWNNFIYQPYKALTHTLVRWLYGLRPPIIASDQFSAMELAEPAPLPLIRKRRLSITSSDSPKVPTISPRFNGKRIETRNQKRYTATQDQCPLFTKLPLELRLLIYRFALGNLTLHIIPSHVPSLTLPPRFSLRTHPFCRRLDFEVGKSIQRHKEANKEDAVAILKDPEICSLERSKERELSQLVHFNYTEGTKIPGAWATPIEYIVAKYGRKGGPLALLKTCRVIYSEAIEILYTTNTFYFSNPETLFHFPSTLLPTRVPLLRHLVFHFNFRQRDMLSAWPQACALLRSLPCLQTLTIMLTYPEIRLYVDGEKESILSPLVNVSVKEEFVVYLDWLETEREREVAEGASFRVVRLKNVEVEEEEEVTRVPIPIPIPNPNPRFRYDNGESWTMREDGPSDPDGM